jgi:hypothetical protein
MFFNFSDWNCAEFLKIPTRIHQEFRWKKQLNSDYEKKVIGRDLVKTSLAKLAPGISLVRVAPLRPLQITSLPIAQGFSNL